MTKLISILWFLFMLSVCADNKVETTEEKHTFFGDRTLALDFEYYTDTTFMSAFKRGDIFEISTYGTSGDTSIVMLRKDLISGCYKGGCEFVKDTLICNYWLDSINCKPELLLTTLVFKLRARDTIVHYNLVFKPTETPKRKDCR